MGYRKKKGIIVDMGENKRQHFVQKAYLENWCFSGNKVWEYRKPSLLHDVSIENIMVERFYNSISATNQYEREFILSFVDNSDDFISRKEISDIYDVAMGIQFFNSVKDKKSIYLNTIDYIVWISSVLEFYEYCPDVVKNDESIKESLLHIRRQLVDEFLGGIERMGFPIIQGIVSGNRVFDHPDYENLIYYCTITLSRTQDNGKRITDVKNPMVDTSKIRAILQFVIGLRLGLVMIAEQSSISVLVNNSSTSFITGSQPCINMYAHPQKEVDKLKLFFPVSPSVALTIGEPNGKRVDEVYLYDSSVIESYNNLIDSFSSCLYSNEKQILQKYFKACVK